jgi:hypothetical protein
MQLSPHFNLPKRQGPRPTTIPCAPHSQTNQIPENTRELSALLVDRIQVFASVYNGPSMRAPRGTVGFYLEQDAACSNRDCFLLGHEFAHIHVDDDGSLHVILPEPQRTEAIEAGWAEPHPLAGQPTVSSYTVMLYAPRNEREVAIIGQLVEISWRNACATANS